MGSQKVAQNRHLKINYVISTTYERTKHRFIGCDNPSMGIHLRDDQRAVLPWAQKTLAREGGVLFADAPGYGKSYQALGLSQLLTLRPIIIAPRALVIMWENYLDEAQLSGEVISYGEMDHLHERWASEGIKDSPLLIVDEAHAFVNPTTRRYRSLARLCFGLPMVFLTATPFQNRMDDALNLLALFSSEAAWLRAQPSIKALVLPSLMRRLSIARTPPAQRPIQRRKYPVNAERGAIETAARAICIQGEPQGLILHWLLSRRLSSYSAWLQSITQAARFISEQRVALDAGRVLTRTTFARDFAHGQRAFPFILDVSEPGSLDIDTLDDSLNVLRASARAVKKMRHPRPWRWILSQQRPVLIFSRYRATVDEIYHHLRPRVRIARWTGAGIDSNFPRTDAPIHTQLSNSVLVATDVAAEGVDLRTCNTLVHADMHWNPMRSVQREGRIRRGEGGSPATVWSPAYPRTLADLWSIDARRAYKQSLPGRFSPQLLSHLSSSAAREDLQDALLEWAHEGFLHAQIQALRNASTHWGFDDGTLSLPWFTTLRDQNLLPAGAATWIQSADSGDTGARKLALMRLRHIQQRLFSQLRTERFKGNLG